VLRSVVQANQLVRFFLTRLTRPSVFRTMLRSLVPMAFSPESAGAVSGIAIPSPDTSLRVARSVRVLGESNGSGPSMPTAAGVLGLGGAVGVANGKNTA
jgi:hypothetical protein